ncbi:MAG: M28 family peptidase [Bacteroidota bacterium]
MVRILVLSFILSVIAGCTNRREQPQGKPSAETQNPPKSIPVPNFDKTRAFNYLVKQTDFGPRNPNSRGHGECREFLIAEFRKLADEVGVQDFPHAGYDGETLVLTNIIASFNPQLKERILLCAHWDTRPRAEQDENKARRNEPIIGANDGASGVAVLLELATLLHTQKPLIGVDLILFDGEDYGKEGDHASYLLGSRYFALNLAPEKQYRFGILLDMVGDKFLDLPKEGNSVKFAPDIVSMVWSKAKELGYSEFLDETGQPVYDDHLPLNEIGIKTIDIIDFNYPDPTHRYWHSHQDIPENCSPESLNAVGTVLTHVIYSQRP